MEIDIEKNRSAGQVEVRDIYLSESDREPQFMLEVFRVDGAAVERCVSTRPNPGCSWSAPVSLHPDTTTGGFR